MGFKFYQHAPNIWKAVDECDRLMLEHKTSMKA
jgi:hypothetical protein